MLLLFKDSGTMFALFMYAVKVLGGVQKGTSWKEAPFGASYTSFITFRNASASAGRVKMPGLTRTAPSGNVPIV